MKITLGGVRGTGPVSGEDFLVYGGGTTSLLVQGQSGASILLDAGTGVRELGVKLQLGERTNRELLLLMTHYHIDHMMGLPSLSVLYSKKWRITMAAPLREGFSVRTMVHRLLAKPFWPVQFSQLQSKIEFKTLKSRDHQSSYTYRDFEIRWCPVHHPDGCTTYRIDEPSTGRSLVFATDLEWGLSSRTEQKAFLRLCRDPAPVDLLLFDGQYTAEEYPLYRGWGHSTWEDALAVAGETEARRLMIIHHAPTRTDRQLAALQKVLRRKAPRAEFAMGGAEVDL